MKLRKVEIDFSEAKVHWSPNLEFSQFINAGSAMLPFFEPFLIKVIREAKDKLPLTATELRCDVDLFVSQESRHYKQHARFNKVIHDAGYESLAPAERKFKADMDRFLADKGLKFCLAYCEGVETFSPILSKFLFERTGDYGYIDDWDQPTAYLFLWHFAEEYEHRTVCNYVYKELYDDHWYRVAMLWYANFHLVGWVAATSYKMIAEDRKKGVIPDKAKSQWRFLKLIGRMQRHIVPTMVTKSMRRHYDPRTDLTEPKDAVAFLERVAERFGVVEPKDTAEAAAAL